MLRNYAAVALRNLARNGLYSGISILGMAFGVCAATLAAVIVRNELSYEHFIPGYENTYLAAAVAVPTGHAPLYNLESPSFVAGLLKLNVPAIRSVTRIASADVRLRHEHIEAKEKVYWADPNAFDLLPLPALSGQLRDALRRPDGIVLTRSIAEKYFHRSDPVGQAILMDDVHAMTVTAVIEDLAANGTMLESGIFVSGLAADSALSQCDREVPVLQKRGAVALCGRTYVRFAAGTALNSLQRAVDAVLVNAYPKFPGMTMGVRLIRIDRVHLFEGLNPGALSRMEIIGAVALIILFASCFVFVNLQMARSTRRALEVGVRKACGASRAALIAQFLGEALIYVTLAACVGVTFSGLLLPYVNAFLNSAGRLDFWHDPTLVGVAVAGVIVVAVLAGAYPAFVLSTFRPGVVLKGTVLRGGGAVARQALVVLQFAVLIALLLAAAVIYRQRIYATHEALRVGSDQMLIIRSPCKAALANELRALPGVRGAHCSSQALLDRMRFLNARLKDGTALAIDVTELEFGTFGLYGIKPLAGSLPTDDGGAGPIQNASQVVINETAARRFGFAVPAAAVGQPLPLAVPAEPAYRIVAVVADFSFDPVGQKVRPGFYVGESDPQRYQLINVKLTGRDIPETLAAIDRIGVAIGNEKPLERFFLDEYIQNLYLLVLREAQAFGALAVVAIVLACFGVLGLSAASMESRIKEIGVRKAMGAGATDILRMLLWQFSKPVVWASLIAWPLSALMLNRWLDGFAYHVGLPPWLFVATSAVAIAITLLTVSTHAVLMARAKPVGALRYE